MTPYARSVPQTRPFLLPHHQALLDASGISRDVAAARGYRSVTTGAELRGLGFKPSQLRVPALLIPQWGVDGRIVNYQIRPDEPRLVRRGRPIKYESPGGSRLRLDVPPGSRDSLPDPTIELAITEAPRKADAAVSRGLVCIALLGVWGWRGSNHRGGTTVLADWDSIALNRRPILIIFDSDVTTNQKVRAALLRLREFLVSRGAQVRIARLPAGVDGAKVGLDDYLASGHSIDDLRALASEGHLEAVGPRETPLDDETEEDGLVLTRASNLVVTRVAWTWAERLPQGELALLVGEPGLGKTTLALNLAARLTRGTLEGDLNVPCEVIYATAEDSPARTLTPRLMAAGADLERIHFIAIRRSGVEEALALPADVASLRQAIDQTEARFVVIDPIMAHLGAGIDSNRDHSIRRALAPLARLAHESDVAILGIAHLNKGFGSNLFERVGGSIGLSAAARSILLLAPDPDAVDEPIRLLVHGKSNLGPTADTLRIRVDGRTVSGPTGLIATAAITWLEVVPGVRASDVLSRFSEDRVTPSAMHEAVEFLEVLLGEGPISATAGERQATERGIAKKTLARARKQLGVKATKTGMDGGWEWSLPPKGVIQPEDGHIPDVGPLPKVWPSSGDPIVSTASGPSSGNGAYQPSAPVSGVALAGSRPSPVAISDPRVAHLAQALPVALRAGPLTISECRGVIGAAPDEIGAALIAARSAGFVIRYGVDGRLHLVEGV